MSLFESADSGDFAEHFDNDYSGRMELKLILRVLARELLARPSLQREPEPEVLMTSAESVAAFNGANSHGGSLEGLHAFITFHTAQAIEGARTVVDLGCGPGQLLMDIAELFPETKFIGVDLSDAALATAETTRLGRGLSNVSFRKDNICELSTFPDHGVDAVISSLAMHHLPDLQHVESMFLAAMRISSRDRRLFFLDLGRMNSLASVIDLLRATEGQPEAMQRDYEASLKAAFTVDEISAVASRVFGDETTFARTWGIPMLMALKTESHSMTNSRLAHFQQRFAKLSKRGRQDFLAIERFFGLGKLQR